MVSDTKETPTGKMMRVAVCDNEAVFLDQFAGQLSAVDKTIEADYYDDILGLFAKIQTGIKYDIVFMDIDWNDDKHTGINYAAMINRNSHETQIIFVTGHNDYSQDIFLEPLNLCGFLVKPVDTEKLSILLSKVEKKLSELKTKVLTVKNNGNVETITISSIIYAESKGHQVFIHMADDVSSVYEKLDEIESRLGEGFLRIHKSFCVNMDHIRKLEGRKLSLTDGTELPVSKNLQKSTRENYLDYLRSQMRE